MPQVAWRSGYLAVIFTICTRRSLARPSKATMSCSVGIAGGHSRARKDDYIVAVHFVKCSPTISLVEPAPCLSQSAEGSCACDRRYATMLLLPGKANSPCLKLCSPWEYLSNSGRTSIATIYAFL